MADQLINLTGEVAERLGCIAPFGRKRALDLALRSAELRRELIAAERDYLFQLLRQGKLTDESRRRIERELDLEEASIFGRNKGEEPPL